MKNCLRLALLSLGVAGLCTSASADPLTDLDDVIRRCKEAFDQRPVIAVAYAGALNAWVKRQYMPVSVTFRARKTNSVVSPYVAQIDVVELAAAQRGEDEQSVRALDVSLDENVMRSTRRINLAFQDNAWTVIGGASTVEVRRDATERFSNVGTSRHSRESLLLANGPIASCLGQPAAWNQSALRVVP